MKLLVVYRNTLYNHIIEAPTKEVKFETQCGIKGITFASGGHGYFISYDNVIEIKENEDA